MADLVLAQKAIDFVKAFQAAVGFTGDDVDGNAGPMTNAKLVEIIRNETALKKLLEAIK